MIIRFEYEELIADQQDEHDTNIWKQIHKLGPKMQAQKLHVNDQFQAYKGIYKEPISFTKEEVKVMLIRDCCRRKDILILDCSVSKNPWDKFVLVLNNLGELSLISYPGQIKVF